MAALPIQLRQLIHTTHVFGNNTLQKYQTSSGQSHFSLTSFAVQLIEQ
jgi:hypothetical protein